MSGYLSSHHHQLLEPGEEGLGERKTERCNFLGGEKKRKKCILFIVFRGERKKRGSFLTLPT